MLSPNASLVVVVLALACTLIPALLAGGFAFHHLGVLMRISRVARASRLDRAGPVVLEGRVVAEAGELEPVKLVLERVPLTPARSAVALSRDVVGSAKLQPFRLALADGSEVLVEPDADTRVCGDPSPASDARQGDPRTRSISIREGDSIQLVGALRASANAHPRSSAFRGAITSASQDGAGLPRALVVRRHPLEPLLLSKRELARDRVRSLLLHALSALLFVALGLSLHLGVLAPFYRLALDGRAMWGTVDEVLDPSGGAQAVANAGDTLRFSVDLGRARATLESDPIDAELANRVAKARRERKPLNVAVFVAAPEGKKPQLVLGSRPRCQLDALPFVLLAALVSASYGLAAGRLRPGIVSETPGARTRRPLAAALERGG